MGKTGQHRERIARYCPKRERGTPLLQLKDIKKDYLSGEETVHALKGINLAFRENEFVSILGQSGCGKTTLLNIIGGLDRYTSGDLVINGKSTKEYKDRDWDTYRNHSIGFVFQSYNLIPHQNVLSNVELALTLSGVSKAERRKRAVEALNKVGLGDQLKKKPNQMSGGQMQRVAIARALVNNPDILLADEPTGALDSETSVQVMEILNEVAKDRLVIRVTHNPELAQQYSTRIIRVLDGEVVSDSMPYTPRQEELEGQGTKTQKKPGMSFFTAMSLSLNNLMTKKGRTFLTAFAGSIGIIGIALILSLSSGMQDYIDKMEEDTLTSYPITIQQATMDMSSMMNSMMNVTKDADTEHESGQIYSASIMTGMIDAMMTEISTNDLSNFKKVLEEDGNEIAALTSEIRYSYPTKIGIYTKDLNGNLQRVNPISVLDEIGMGELATQMGMNSIDVCTELTDNESTRDSDYELLTGSWPRDKNEVVLIVDKNNEVSDYTLYALGLMDTQQLKDAITDAQKNLADGGTLEESDIAQAEATYSYEDFLGLDLRLVLPTDEYKKTETGYVDKSEDESYMETVYENAEPLKVVGIVRNTAENGNEYGTIGYTSQLTAYVVGAVDGSEIVKAQKENPEVDVFTGLPFRGTEAGDAALAAQGAENTGYNEAQSQLIADTVAKLPEMYQSQLTALPEDQQAKMLIENNLLTQDALDALGDGDETEAVVSDGSYDGNLTTLGAATLDDPGSISLYAASFEEKEALTDALDAYNDKMTEEGKDDQVIHYTDYVGLLMSSVTDIVNIVSYVLIAFVGISLVVSSIMIGVITLISVQERTKEIGILRSIGASKRDVSRVFNAETLMIGLGAGVIGIAVTLILNIPINMVIHHLAGIENVAKLPAAGGVILVVISVVLTMIAGLIPARTAAKKDPVEALRTE